MKRIEKVLKEIVKVFKIILGDSIEGFIIVNYEGIIEFINKSYCDFLKIEQTKAVGRNVAEIIPSTRVLDVLKSGKEEINWKHQYDDGREVIVNRIPIIVKGQIVGVLGQVIFRDMNNRSQETIKLSKLLEYIKNVK